jgi:hypothetical protein
VPAGRAARGSAISTVQATAASQLLARPQPGQVFVVNGDELPASQGVLGPGQQRLGNGSRRPVGEGERRGHLGAGFKALPLYQSSARRAEQTGGTVPLSRGCLIACTSVHFSSQSGWRRTPRAATLSLADRLALIRACAGSRRTAAKRPSPNERADRRVRRASPNGHALIRSLSPRAGLRATVTKRR